MEITELQTQNQERMILFTCLVKALLLHEIDENLIDSVKEPYRRSLLQKLNSKDCSDYREWLSDRFFIFYLNRSRQSKVVNDE